MCDRVRVCVVKDEPDWGHQQSRRRHLWWLRTSILVYYWQTFKLRVDDLLLGLRTLPVELSRRTLLECNLLALMLRDSFPQLRVLIDSHLLALRVELVVAMEIYVLLGKRDHVRVEWLPGRVLQRMSSTYKSGTCRERK